MAKQKPPTPQELYRQRRIREEQERTAYLPPGLINHGNTCFMNSVLQGLIATRLLSDLVHFAPVPPAVQERATTLISAKRSPQLTNGHNLAGPYEQPWVNTMPIGDIFLSTVYKSWEHQAKRQRDVMSPRAVLSTLGRKYDQYLDFAQQDAHEFLRILLDAMRMEEQDIIKKRQPPPQKKRRRSTIVPGPPITAPELPEDEILMSFVGMIFGGRLTSILVCQKCKHVSQTYEDFNDISLSIKPEDYIHRKRDKLKNLAKRLTNNFPSPAIAKIAAPEIQRSSSVPPSPKERPDGQLINHEESPPPSASMRRKSMEFHATEEEEKKDEDEPVLVNVTAPDPEEKDTNWTKLSRRFSLGLGKPRDKKRHRVSAPIIEGVRLDEPPPTTKHQRKSMIVPSSSPLSDSPRPSLDVRPISQSASSSSSVPTRSKSPKPPKPTHAENEYLRKILADVDTGGSSNPFNAIFKPQPQHQHQHHHHHSTSTSTPAFSPHNVWLGGKTLSGIEECLRMFTAVEVLDGENMVGCRRCWKIANGVLPKSKQGDDYGQADSDSDDTPPPTQETDPSNPSFSHDRTGPLPHIQPPSVHIPTSISTPTVSYYTHHPLDNTDKSDTRSISSLPATAIHPDTDGSLNHSSISQSSGSPSSSTSRRNSTSRSGSSVESGLEQGGKGVGTPGGLPIPSISTTAPEAFVDSALSLAPSLERVSIGAGSHVNDTSSKPGPSLTNGIASPRPIRPINSNFDADVPTLDSKDSLLPPPRHVRRKSGSGDVTTTDDELESSGEETDTSFATSVSADSVNVSDHRPPTSSPSASSKPVADGLSASSSSSQQQAPAKKQSKPKPVIMRPAYKRYLVATPPPVLVIHLKRFQQLTKNQFLSFSHGFKKLEDYVTFPEYLDLTPFLAPRKEDYGLGKKNKSKLKKEGKKTEERCMYRLYAVVVHIGNMLGGHYIAYTALPSRSPIEGEGLATKDGSAPNPEPSVSKTQATPSTSTTTTTSYLSSPDPAATPALTVTPSAHYQLPSHLQSAKAAAVGTAPPVQPTKATAPQTQLTNATVPAQQAQPTKASASQTQPTKVPPPSSSTSQTSATPQVEPKARQWAYISDTIVRLTTLEEVLNAKAYMCMYERC